MPVTQYRLSWDSYTSNVCNGFTSLQQNEEFVDMTLAADGHLVKVHKSIFALASPYIKSMLQATPNEHPIIFLSSVSCEVLNHILTYVYTGEVSVEVDNIQSFMKVAKDLRLSGLFGTPTPKVTSNKYEERIQNDIEQSYGDNIIPNAENEVEKIISDNSILADNSDITDPVLTNTEILDTSLEPKKNNESNEQYVSNKYTLSGDMNIQGDPNYMSNEDVLNDRESEVYTTADGYQFKIEPCIIPPSSTPFTVKDSCNEASDLMQTSNNTTAVVSSVNNDNFSSFEDEFKKKINTESLLLDSINPKAITLQYTMSTRGSLQLILNRFMYYCHHQSHGGRKRRWRCIEYRSKHCPAFIDTDNEIMVSRKFGHGHSFHDEKIRIKMKRDLIFTNLAILLEKLNEKNKSKKMEK